MLIADGEKCGGKLWGQKREKREGISIVHMYIYCNMRLPSKSVREITNGKVVDPDL